MKGKTNAKPMANKVEVKAVETKTVAKTDEVAAVKEAAKEVSKETKEVAKTEETKAAATETKAAVAEKKTATKKAAAKTTKKAVKEELKPEVFIQYQGREAIVADAIEKAKAAYVAEGHRVSSIKSLQIYLKPEEYAAYYVINQKFAGRVDLF